MMPLPTALVEALRLDGYVASRSVTNMCIIRVLS